LVVYEELLALVPNEAYKTYLYTHLVCSVHESKQTAMESRLIRFDKDFDTACIKRALEQVVQAEAALAKAVRDSMSIKATGRERNNQVEFSGFEHLRAHAADLYDASALSKTRASHFYNQERMPSAMATRNHAEILNMPGSRVRFAKGKHRTCDQESSVE